MSSVAEKLQRKSQRATATKQVRLKLVYIDFWSAVKLSFLIALCLGIVTIVATFLVGRSSHDEAGIGVAKVVAA